ncbi:uncharacterized protein EAE98_006579 [Botrytis deweyae]|uniref:Uncharacterized protein n=1 Tax=Botrytis deweyae TaxID=2478750 RepID=A0ABQ7IJR5_9HELO|nr:uncharacterized protein EAE98_006579 [Botrytis deweyae]KAF7926284.1 hypothetical protein EAE98_006579 [Botrytis deweyae]
MPMLANFTALNLSNIMGSMDGRIDHVSHSHFVDEDFETLTKAYKIGNVILMDILRQSLSQSIREIGEWLASIRLLQHSFLIRWLLVRPVISQMHMMLLNL